MYNEEVNVYLGLVEGRRESMNTRAGLLIAASAIAASFTTASGTSLWILVALACASVAAIVGIAALWPMPTKIHDLGAIRGTLLKAQSHADLKSVADTKFENIGPAVQRLKRSAQLVRVGFLLLGAAVICSLIHAFPTICAVIGAPNGNI